LLTRFCSRLVLTIISRLSFHFSQSIGTKNRFFNTKWSSQYKGSDLSILWISHTAFIAQALPFFQKDSPLYFLYRQKRVWAWEKDVYDTHPIPASRGYHDSCFVLQWIAITYTWIVSFLFFLSSISPILSFHSYYFFTLTSINICIPFLCRRKWWTSFYMRPLVSILIIRDLFGSYFLLPLSFFHRNIFSLYILLNLSLFLVYTSLWDIWRGYIKRQSRTADKKR